MNCRSLMKTDVESVLPTDSVEQAARIMRAAEVGFLPVCDPRGRPLGTLTDRDLALRVCAEDLQPSETDVGSVMTHEVVACGADDPLSAAEQLMSGYRKSRIMCVDATGKLVGVLSLSDVVEAEEDSRAALTLRKVAAREVHGRRSAPRSIAMEAAPDSLRGDDSWRP